MICIRKILILFTLLLIFPKITEAEEQQGRLQPDEVIQQLFLACEQLRMNDPHTRIQGVETLFHVKGLYAYTILQYLWVAETDHTVRQEILKGFKQIGDHVYIADPDFPHYWMQRLTQYHEAERHRRLRELKQFFPQQVDMYEKNSDTIPQK